MKLFTLSVIALALVSSGCGGKKAPPASPDAAAVTTPTEDAAAAPTPDAAPAAPDAAAAAPDAAATAPADCVVPEVMATLGSIDPDFAKLDGNAVSLCGLAGETRHCIALDLATGKRTTTKLDDADVAHLPAFPAGFDDGLVKDETRPVLKLCPAAETRCKDLHIGTALGAHFDATKARVVVTAMDDGKLNAHLYDAATQAELTVIPIGASDLPNCTFAAFVGESLLLATGACTGGGKAWLADAKTGAKIADIGKMEGTFVRDGQFAYVEGNLWAFRDASGKAVYLQDVATGEVQTSIDLEKASDGTKAKDDQAFVFTTVSDIILVESRPLVGTIYVASRKDGSVSKVHLARPCP